MRLLTKPIEFYFACIVLILVIVGIIILCVIDMLIGCLRIFMMKSRGAI
jgi:hypothetical protein